MSARWLLASLSLSMTIPAAAEGLAYRHWPAEVRTMHADNARNCRRRFGGRLRWNPGDAYVRRTDLNGDGRPDYLVDTRATYCSTAVALNCGSHGCGLIIFVSAPGGGFQRQGIVVHGYEVVRVDGRTLLRFPRGDGRVNVWGWNGREIALLRRNAL